MADYLDFDNYKLYLKELKRQLEFTYGQLKYAEIERTESYDRLIDAYHAFDSPTHGSNPLCMYLFLDHKLGRSIVDMCIRNNYRSDDNLNDARAFNLSYGLDHYYIQLDTIKGFQIQIEKLQALVDSSL